MWTLKVPYGAIGILIVILALIATPISAQQQAPTLETMLSDAGYVLNRYDELASGINCDSWRVPDSLKRSCKDELKSVGENVSVTKAILARLRDTKEDDLVALFRVYRELNEVSGHLDELSGNLPNYTQFPAN